MRTANIIEFGADPTGTTDSAPAVQSALNQAKQYGATVYAPRGSYRVDSVLNYSGSGPGLRLFGDGMDNTILHSNVPNASLIQCDGYESTPTFQRGGWFRDLTIKSNNPSDSGGVNLRAVWHHDIERVCFKNLSGNALTLLGKIPPGDPDGTAAVTVRNCQFQHIVGTAIRLESPWTGVSHSQIRVSDSIIQTCGRGIELNGVYLFLLENTAVVGCQKGGLIAHYNGVANNQLLVSGCEFGNGNKPYSIRLDSMLGARIENTLFTSNDGERGSHGIIFGDGIDLCKQIRVSGCRFRVHGSTPFEAYSFSATAENISVEQTVWSQFDAVGQTRFSGHTLGRSIKIVDEGIRRNGFITTTPTGSYTPDLSRGKFHRIIASMAIINSPTTYGSPLLGGEEIVFECFNNGADPQKPYFDAANYSTNPPMIEPSRRATCAFFYDPVSGMWTQIGEWATNL